MVVMINNYPNHLRWLENFRKYLEKCGHKVVGIVDKKPFAQYESAIRDPDCKHVFMWNGEEANLLPVRKLCSDCGVPCSIVEVGFFPQKDFYFIDRLGINANSSIMTGDMSVSDEDVKAYESFRLSYLAGRTWKKTNKYILVPLQLGSDTNIMLHSPFTSMGQFIEHAESKFPDKPILFKRHPLDKADYKVSPKNQFITGGHILDVAQDAELVYGINSTSLLETAMLGVPTVSTGRGFLMAHGHKVDTLLAYLCKRQVPVTATDLSKWLRPTPQGGFEVVE